MLTSPCLAQPTTTLDELVAGIKSEVRDLAAHKVVYEEYLDFKNGRHLQHLSYFDYLKSKVAFECTRDSGLWHVAWAITDRQPDSKNVWAQWKAVRGRPKSVTAIAECDEISALYAFLARKLGVGGIGLFWPTSNHTVAVWKLEGQRVVVPTTPIFLERYDGFDAKGFDPRKQSVIYDYTAEDVPGNYLLPRPLAVFFLAQVREYGGASKKLLHELRYAREHIQRGEPGPPSLERAEALLKTAADRRALKAFRKQFHLPQS